MKRDVPEDQYPRGRTSRLSPGKGLLGIRKFRKLRAQHPNLELDEVWALAGYGPQERKMDAASAPWADGRASPAQARIRNDPRKEE